MQILLDFYNQVLNTLSFFTGLDSQTSFIVFRIIIAEIVVFLVIIPLHRLILRRISSTKQNLVQQMDEVIYLLAKAQYSSNISEQDLWWDPHFAMMKEMFQSAKFEYLDNVPRLKDFSNKVQLLLNTTIATDQQRTTISKLQKKMKILIFFSRLVWILICIFTLWLYRLFR